MSKTKVVVAVVNGLSGVMAWAYRLRQAFPSNGPYELCLMGCRESKDYGEIDLYAPTLRDARRTLRDAGAAIVVPNFLFDLFDVSADLMHEGAPVRTIGYCRADDAREYYEPLRFYDRIVSRFVAVSDRCAERLAGYVPERAADITVLPTGIDVPDSLSRTFGSRPLRLVYGGRLEQHQKRVLDLVGLVQRLLDASVDFQLSIAGGGKQGDELRHALDALPHHGRVALLGRLPYGDMADLWGRHDVFLQVSEYEGTSNSMLEAMARGAIPIVTETDSGSRSVIDDGRNGFLVPVGDMKGMADRIADLARWTPPRLEAVGRRAYESAKPYAMRCYVARFLEILDQAAAAPPRTRAALVPFPAHPSFGLPMVP